MLPLHWLSETNLSATILKNNKGNCLNFFLKIFKLLPPELAHSFSLNSLNILHKLKVLGLFFNKIEHDEKVTFLGMEFNNRLGTAAGLDLSLIHI